MDSIHKKMLSSMTRRKFFGGLAMGLLATALVPVLTTSSANAAAPAKTLIVYYSRSGNTRQIVSQIQKTISADVIELTTVQPYPAEYRATTEQAKRELAENYRPALSNTIGSLDEYDTVILGSPNWWGTIAMPMFSFLDAHDLSGKKVAVFITHGGSRLGRAMDDVRKLCPRARVMEGLAIRSSDVGSAQKDVNEWLKKIGSDS